MKRIKIIAICATAASSVELFKSDVENDGTVKHSDGHDTNLLRRGGGAAKSKYTPTADKTRAADLAGSIIDAQASLWRYLFQSQGLTDEYKDEIPPRSWARFINSQVALTVFAYMSRAFFPSNPNHGVNFMATLRQHLEPTFLRKKVDRTISSLFQKNVSSGQPSSNSSSRGAAVPVFSSLLQQSQGTQTSMKTKVFTQTTAAKSTAKSKVAKKEDADLWTDVAFNNNAKLTEAGLEHLAVAGGRTILNPDDGVLAKDASGIVRWENDIHSWVAPWWFVFYSLVVMAFHNVGWIDPKT